MTIITKGPVGPLGPAGPEGHADPHLGPAWPLWASSMIMAHGPSSIMTIHQGAISAPLGMQAQMGPADPFWAQQAPASLTIIIIMDSIIINQSIIMTIITKGPVGAL